MLIVHRPFFHSAGITTETMSALKLASQLYLGSFKALNSGAARSLATQASSVASKSERSASMLTLYVIGLCCVSAMCDAVVWEFPKVCRVSLAETIAFHSAPLCYIKL